MRNLEPWVLCYLLNSLWQIPLLLIAGWVAARAVRTLGAEAEHQVWVGVLLLQCTLPALCSLPGEWFAPFVHWGKPHTVHADVSAFVGPGSGAATVHLPAKLLTMLVVGYFMTTAYFAIRFAWRWIKLATMRREACEVALAGEAAAYWTECAKRFGLESVSIATSSKVSGPVTIGISRKLLLLPAGMISGLPTADLLTVIAHEFAHMRRKDFLKNLAYEVLALPVSYHPLFWIARERIMESREVICDQMAARIAGRTEYARSLLRLASLLVDGMPIRTPHAIGIFDANAFERRLMRLTGKEHEVRRMRSTAIRAACAAFGLAICVSTFSLSTRVAVAAGGNSNASSSAEPLTVPAGVMAGNIVTKVQPKYPVEAKKEKIQGKVLLSAIIGKDGEIEKLTVVSGPKELQQSSLDAVQQWTFKPYLLNGEPVEVKTTITVFYSLAS